MNMSPISSPITTTHDNRQTHAMISAARGAHWTVKNCTVSSNIYDYVMLGSVSYMWYVLLYYDNTSAAFLPCDTQQNLQESKSTHIHVIPEDMVKS